MPRAIFLIVLLASAMAVSAQTYKWKDASGNVQYSDMPPPPGAKDVQQLRKATGASTPAAGTTPQAKTVTDQEAEFRKRLAAKQEAEAKQAKAQQEEESRARNCEQAKSHLAAIEAGGRLVRFNEKGERILLDDSERESQKAEARKAIETWCK